MPTIFHQFTVTIPAGTAIDSPYVTQVVLPNEVVEYVDVQVPPGPAGLMGFYLALNGVPQIPFEAGEYIVWDDYEYTFNLTDFPTTGNWSVVGYNLDEANDHAIYLRFGDDPLPAPTVSPPAVTIVQGTSPLEPVVL